MPAIARKGAIIGAIMTLSAIFGLSLTSGAGAETAHHPKHVVARGAAPLAPGVELRTSTLASPGSENRYYSDTVASSHSDLMDMTHRYGQSTAPQYNGPDPLFEF
jgi:hypothetical protein